MTTAAEKRSLHAKLAAVMADAERIPKNGSYTGQGSFRYVLVGDAADAIRKALGDRKVSMLPSAVEVIGESEHATRSGGTMTTLTIRTTWTLVDGETGETATIQSIGTGADAGDKASPKAQTNAMKYALLMGFLLSTGDDPEQADSSDRQAAEVSKLLGRIQKTGKLMKGGPDQYKGEWYETPDGHAIGFKFKLDGEDRDIPQVVINGPLGEALYVGHPELLGQRVTLKGHLYNVTVKPNTWLRLIVGERPEDFVETSDLRIPPLPDPEQAVVDANPEGVSPLREDDAIPVAEGQTAAWDQAESDRLDREAAAAQS